MDPNYRLRLSLLTMSINSPFIPNPQRPRSVVTPDGETLTLRKCVKCEEAFYDVITGPPAVRTPLSIQAQETRRLDGVAIENIGGSPARLGHGARCALYGFQVCESRSSTRNHCYRGFTDVAGSVRGETCMGCVEGFQFKNETARIPLSFVNKMPGPSIRICV
jgi:hypothetical protein